MEGSISVGRFCLEGLSWKGKRILLSLFILQHCNTGQFILHLHRSLCGSLAKIDDYMAFPPFGDLIAILQSKATGHCTGKPITAWTF